MQVAGCRLHMKDFTGLRILIVKARIVSLPAGEACMPKLTLKEPKEDRSRSLFQ